MKVVSLFVTASILCGTIAQFSRETIPVHSLELGEGFQINGDRFDLDGREALVKKVREILGAEAARKKVGDAINYLVRFMPSEDVKALSPKYVAKNIHFAFQARHRFWMKWARQVPWPIFLNEVLPYASLTEPRDDWREKFFKFMAAKVDSCQTATCAAVTLNGVAWTIVDPPIVFVAAEPNKLNSYSPFQTMARHNSSCTGLSIFLVDALRSIGIPARIAGVPHWHKTKAQCPHGDSDPDCGNHNWVEAYLDGEWHFIDQHGEVTRVDEGWFFPQGTNGQYHSTEQNFNHSIFASSWAPTALLKQHAPLYYSEFEPFPFFPLAWDWGNQSVHGWETVAWYHSLA